ncbi:MAG: hypothetical protein ABR535_09960 [Pyrinomonadaceae bacterium]
MAGGALGQDTKANLPGGVGPKSDFSGIWTLDKSQSTLDDAARIESMTLTVAQTETDVKVVSETKRTPLPEGFQRGSGRRGGFGGGDGTLVYAFDKETTTEVEGRMGKVPVKLMAKMRLGRLQLTSSRTVTGPSGEISMTTSERWLLSGDGKTLTVNRDTEMPQGKMSSTLVFVKK